MELLLILGGGWVIALGGVAISIWLLIQGVAVLIGAEPSKE